MRNEPQIGHFLQMARSRRQAGDLPGACDALRSILRLYPDIPEVRNDLAVTYMRLGRFDEAEQELKQALSLNSAYVMPRYNLAQIYLHQRRFTEALEQLQAVEHIGGNSSDFHECLGTTLLRLGEPGRAIGPLQSAISLNPNSVSAWCHLGLALEDLGRRDEALAALQRASALDPGSPTIAFHLAALDGSTPPAACPREYLVQLFDDYADHFDRHLVDELHYRGPQLMFDAIKSLRPDAANLDVIDLGCGTGLACELFRPMARRLVGVDLAPRMIERAAKRRVYHELLQDEVVHTLCAHPASFDLALAGDLLIYIGDLTPLFSALATSLRPGGIFAFTIESIDSPDFALRPTRRYAHSGANIRRLAQHHGFQIAVEQPAVLREGPAGPVAGAVFVLVLSPKTT